MFIKFYILIALILFTFIGVSEAQDTSDTGGYPSPIYKPENDLDQFEMSTLGSGDLSERQTGSTFSKPLKEETNAELNKAADKAADQGAKGEAALRGKISDIRSRNANDLPSLSDKITPPSFTTPIDNGVTKTGKLYRWVDKKGVIHVTNNIVVVPQDIKDEQDANPVVGDNAQE